MKKKLVLKLGSHVLTQGQTNISRGKLEDVARQIIKLREDYDIVLVSSGAIAAAKHYLHQNDPKLESVFDKQALASIGQAILMKIYQEVFSDYNLGVGQCLLTYNDFERKLSTQNTLNLFSNLWKGNYIPIVNENDAIATDEIKFGDNDKLAALTAKLIQANLMVLASDINGLYTDDPKENPHAELIKEVKNLDQVRRYIKDSKSKLGSGGMTSKFVAAEICMENNIEMWIVNGMEENFLLKSMSSDLLHTRFV